MYSLLINYDLVTGIMNCNGEGRDLHDKDETSWMRNKDNWKT